MYTQQVPGRQLRRDSANKVIAGVCSGISEYFGVSLTFTRIVFILLTFGYGVGVIIYLLLALVIPARGSALLPEQTAQYGSTLPSSRKSILAYITGSISALASFVVGSATFLTSMSTIVSILFPSTPASIMSTPVTPTSSVSAQPSFSINGIYSADIASDDNADTRITQIAIDNSSTQVFMSYHNTGNEDVYVQVEAPGNAGAFYIADSGGRRYELIGVGGIALAPSSSIVAPGHTLKFVLTFERMDDSVTEFNIIEAGSGDPEVHYWRFSKIHFKE